MSTITILSPVNNNFSFAAFSAKVSRVVSIALSALAGFAEAIGRACKRCFKAKIRYLNAPHNFNFKTVNTFKDRKTCAGQVLQKNPGTLPVIVERHFQSKAQDMDKQKFLAPSNITLIRFLLEIKKHAKEQEINLYVNNQLLFTWGQTISEIYASLKDADGFLYVSYTAKNEQLKN